ncbi:MAG: acyloxyacyl hydrolase [Sphingomonas sp.]|nr:acyloxyacyl hydrolase [Sphingomonas sp.]
MKTAVICAALLAGAAPGAAQAAELFGGLHVHDVKTPLDDAGLESGVDVSLGIRGNTIGHLWKGALQPYVFAAVNTAGNTNYGAVGISAKYQLGNGWYFRPGLGVAVHTGSAGKFYRTDKIAFGSRVLFEPEIGLGAQINSHLSLEASWVHMSHAQLAGKENPGIDNLGVRLNLAL